MREQAVALQAEHQAVQDSQAGACLELQARWRGWVGPGGVGPGGRGGGWMGGSVRSGWVFVPPWNARASKGFTQVALPMLASAGRGSALRRRLGTRQRFVVCVGAVECRMSAFRCAWVLWSVA